MEDDFADRLIDLDTFAINKKRYESEIQKLQEELAQGLGKQSDVQKLLKKGIHVVR
jgi:hypothetical protein